MHYRSCLVTVRVKAKWENCQIFKAVQRLAGASVTKTANFTGVSRAAVYKVMTGIHKSLKDTVSYEEQRPKTKNKGKGSL